MQTALLTPVLELTPGTYASRERALPAGTSDQNPEGWHVYWTECLADAGIHGLAPWRIGSTLVPASHFTERSILRTLLQRHVDEVTDWTEDVGALSGGYILTHGEHSLLPGCCGDLGNLEEWREAVETADDTWRMLWIGHPWTFVRRHGRQLHFAEPSDADSPANIVEAFSMPSETLAEAIAAAASLRGLFAARLLPLVEELRPTISADLVVTALTGHQLG